MQKTKMKVRNGSILSSVAVGLGASVAITILCACIGAIFITNEYLKPHTMIYVSVIIQFIASFVGAVAAGRIAGENMLPASMLASVSYFTVLMAVALLIFEGVTSGVFWGIVAVFAGAGGAIVLCIRVKSPPRRKRRRMANR